MTDLDPSTPNQPTRPTTGDRIRAAATPRVIAAAVVVYLASVVVLQVSTAQVASHADAFTKPDLTFGYDLDRVSAALGSLGAAGREAYGLNLLIDSVMPAAFAVAALLAIARAFPRRLGFFAIAPLAFFGLDIVENAALGLMLVAYPELPAALVGVASVVTMVKLSAYLLAFPTFTVALVALLAGRSRTTVIRLAGWAVALAIAAVVVVSLRVDPPAFTAVGVAVAVAWGAALALLAERSRA